MSIMDDYKQLQMIGNVKRIKEMEICYKSNLKLVKKQEQQINKLATCIEEIKEIAEKCCIMQAILDCENYDDCTQCGRTSDGEGIQQILQKISECEVMDE